MLNNFVKSHKPLPVKRESLSLQDIFLNYGLYIAIGIIFLCFSLLNDHFCTLNNMKNVVDQSSYYLVCAMGVTFVLISGANDMSVGAQVAFSSVIGALYLQSFKNIPVSMGIMIALGILIGLVNGLFVVIIGLPPFIGTISTGYVVRGIVAYTTQQFSVTGLPSKYTAFAWGEFLGLSNCTWVGILIVLLSVYILNFTSYGRKLYACGGNRAAANVMGINTTAVKISAYIIAGITSACSAMLLMSRQGMANSGTGELLHMDCIAAAVIGGTSLSGGHGKILGTVVGVFFISMVKSGLNALGLNAFWQMVFTGGILVFAAILDSVKSRNNA